jgi:hypothetical protein
MNRKTKRFMQLKNKLTLITKVICLCVFITANPIHARTLEAGISYQMPEKTEIVVKVSHLPTIYPWLERDENSKVKIPKNGSEVITQTSSDIELGTLSGKSLVLPAGSRIIGYIVNQKAPKSFWRSGDLKIKFTRIEIPDSSTEFKSKDDLPLSSYDGKHAIKSTSNSNDKQIDISDSSIEYTGKENNLGANIASTAGYTVAGAIAAPIITYMIGANLASSAAGFAAISNPYVAGGSAALGGALGLIYGISKKGKTIELEPGKELKIVLDEPWLISKALSEIETNKIASPVNKNFDLKIIKTKITKDAFGDKALKLSIAYNNKTNEEISYNSFQVIDSMGSTFYPSTESISEEYFDEFPNQGVIDLYFGVEFPKALHQLKVLKRSDRKTLALININPN